MLLPILPASSSWLSHARQIAEQSRIDPKEVDLAQAIAWQHRPGVLWVDTRSSDAFSHSHIPGAVLLNEDQWDELFPEFFAHWRPELHVVVYCDSSLCDASHQVAERLRKDLEADRVHVLHGGWQTWLEAQDRQ
ncbi:MAG: rhodanese-like domain-containing protein [Phycisphaeraceae bacterium]|nr:rhodanese-like domain-containing protein [Phycisphaeraceae bacterium]